MDSDDDKSMGGSAPTANSEQIASALRSAVQKQFKLDGNVIPSVMRARVEEELGLAEGFFKSDPHWKSECKAVIKGEFETLTEAAEVDEAPAPKKKPGRKLAAKKASAAKSPAKRATVKKTKKDEPVADDEAAVKEEEEEGATPKKPAARRGKAALKKATPKKVASKRGKAKPTVKDEEDEVEDAAPAPAPVAPLAPTAPTTVAESDSELSELEDEPPKKPTKRTRIPNNAEPKKPTPKRSKAKSTVNEDSDIGENVPEPPTTAPAAVASDSEPLATANEPPKMKPRKRSLSASGAGAKAVSPNKKAKMTPKSSPKEERKEPMTTEEPKAPERPSTPAADDAGSDGEMSVVLDPTPQKGRSSAVRKVPAPKKTKSPKVPQGRKSKAKKADSKEDVPLDPEQEQLKNLKAWLLKCGIRKIWSRELAKFENPRAQITHLKSLLTEAGMTGRYSADKAKKIKEERELRAEVEAVQLGAGEWGHDDEGSGKRKVSTRSMRNAPAAKTTTEKKEIRGLEEFAFLDDQSDSD